MITIRKSQKWKKKIRTQYGNVKGMLILRKKPTNNNTNNSVDCAAGETEWRKIVEKETALKNTKFREKDIKFKSRAQFHLMRKLSM